MRSNTLAGRVCLALGVFAPTALAQEQSTVKVLIPYASGGETKEYLDAASLEVLETTDDTVVFAVEDEHNLYGDGELSSLLRPTITVGPHTFRQYQSVSTTMELAYTTETLDVFNVYDCTYIGCPEPTVGSCTFEVRQGTYSNSESYTMELEASDFNDLTLPTTIPGPLKNECDSGAGGEKGGDDEEAAGTEDGDSEDDKEAAGSGDGDSEEDKEGAAGKVAMAWLGLVPGLVLGLAV